MLLSLINCLRSLCISLGSHGCCNGWSSKVPPITNTQVYFPAILCTITQLKTFWFYFCFLGVFLRLFIFVYHYLHLFICLMLLICFSLFSVAVSDYCCFKNGRILKYLSMSSTLAKNDGFVTLGKITRFLKWFLITL